MSDTQYVDAHRLSYGNNNNHDPPLSPNSYSKNRASRVYGDTNGTYSPNRATSWDNNQRLDSDLSKHASFTTANDEFHGRSQSALYGTGSPTSPMPMLDGQTPRTGHFPRDESPMDHKLNTTQKSSKEIPGAGAYYAMSGILGFKEKQSLILFIIFGGALLGYCCFEMQALGDENLEKFTKPGEWFNLGKGMWKNAYNVHNFLSIFGSILIVQQFFPTIRRNWTWYHRVNGYLCLLLLIIANITGGIVGFKSFGGEINVQSCYYSLAVGGTLCFFVGYGYARVNTREHRRWMIRGVNLFATVITAALIGLAARPIVTHIGTYFSIWRCNEVMAILTNRDELAERFPACVANGVDVSKQVVAVFANIHEGELGKASAFRVERGMSLWFAILIQVLAGEAYLLATDDENYYKVNHALEPRDTMGELELPGVGYDRHS